MSYFINIVDVLEVCQLPKDVGPCRTQIEKWFFDMTTQECKKFGWSCRGNRNRFDSLEECLHTCQSLRGNFKIKTKTPNISMHVLNFWSAFIYYKKVIKLCTIPIIIKKVTLYTLCTSGIFYKMKISKTGI